MNGREKTQVISVHRLRRVARKKERELQYDLDGGHSRIDLGLPAWTNGVRVEKAGFFQHAVVATSRKGH